MPVSREAGAAGCFGTSDSGHLDIGVYEDYQPAAVPSKDSPVDRARSSRVAWRCLASMPLFALCAVVALAKLAFVPAALLFAALCLGCVVLVVRAWVIAYAPPPIRLTIGARVALVLATVFYVLVAAAVPVVGGMLFVFRAIR